MRHLHLIILSLFFLSFPANSIRRLRRSDDSSGSENEQNISDAQDDSEEEGEHIARGEIAGNRRRNLSNAELHGDIVQFWHLRDKKIMDDALQNAIRRDSNKRWVKYTDSEGNYVIPYEISWRFSYDEKQTILDGMRQIEENTCIRYRQHDGEANYLYIDGQDSGALAGCFAWVGMCTYPTRDDICSITSGGGYRNLLNLQNNGACTSIRTVIHELSHSLGLHHEHNRHDRDQYITIHWDRINYGEQPQFMKVDPFNTDTYGSRYDYRSVMHYTQDAFSRYGNTITAKDPDYQYIMGMEGPTGNDYRKICAIYSCSRCIGEAINPITMTTRPPKPTTPSDDSTSESSDEEELPTHCAYCRPSPFCARKDEGKYSAYFRLYCCGDCGTRWRMRWCSELSRKKRRKWRKMCTFK